MNKKQLNNAETSALITAIDYIWPDIHILTISVFLLIF